MKGMDTTAETMVLEGLYPFLEVRSTVREKKRDVITVSPLYLSFDLFPVFPTGII